MNTILDKANEIIFLGNSLYAYFIAIIIFFALFFGLKIYQNVLLKKLEKLARRTITKADDLVLGSIKSIKPKVYSYVSFYVALQTLSLSGFVNKVSQTALYLILLYQVVHTFKVVIDYILKERLNNEESENSKNAFRIIASIVKWVIWILGVLLVLQNLGINVTSLIAGLGIGGIAIAFAFQKILGDLFSSFAILLDKPFVVGDAILVKDHIGIVEHIGIKTTRLRALQGEEIVISNSDLLSSTIQNFRKLNRRRIVFSLTITYETPNEKIEKIPELVKKATEDADLEFSRVHFKSFGDSALIFEVVYFVNSNGYDEYIKAENILNTKIKEYFEKEGIDFAYPTVTNYIKK